MSASGSKKEKAGAQWLRGVAAAVVLVVVTLGLNVGKAIAEDSEPVLQYVKMTPVIINVQSERRRAAYMKITPVLVTSDQAYHEYLESNMPVIRNSLLSLYSNLTAEELLAKGGVDKMRKVTLENLQSLLGTHRITDVLFNDFIVQ